MRHNAASKPRTLPVKLALPILLVAFLGGCMQPTAILPRPPEGYQALRFKQTVQIDAWEFAAGSTFAQDRVRERDGVRLWCGLVVLRMMRETAATCLRIDGNQIGIGAEVLDAGHVRDLPVGSTEIIRLP